MNNYSTKTTAKIRNFFHIKEKNFLRPLTKAHFAPHFGSRTHYHTASFPIPANLSPNFTQDAPQGHTRPYFSASNTPPHTASLPCAKPPHLPHPLLSNPLFKPALATP